MKGTISTVICLTLLMPGIEPVYAGWFGPDNYAECLFDSLQHVSNDKAVVVVVSACSRQFPEKPRRGWFDPDNYDACITQNMRGIENDKATLAIMDACRQLYDDD